MERAYRAVLFIDVVESVRLVEEDEDDAISRWLKVVSLIETLVAPSTGGRIVKRLGDGMLIEFNDVRSAVAAAFAIQRASALDNAGSTADRQILLRTGIEFGNVIVDRNDVYGRGVNAAARLMGLAGPGEIVVSANARDQLTAALDAEIVDLGECYVRHVREPIRAFRVGPPGPLSVARFGSSLREMRPSLAVVPFNVRGGSEDQEIVGDMLAEEMIRAFCRSQELNVISHLSMTAFRGRRFSLKEVSTHLNADYVLSGSCSLSGGAMVLDAELAESKSDRIVWSERLSDTTGGIVAGAEELIGRTVAGVSRAVMSRELQRARSQPLPTLQNYTLLLGAITLMHRLSVESFNEAREMLETIIDRGSHQPIALSWLAKWHVMRTLQGWSNSVEKDGYRALELTKRALDADPELSLALAMDGFVHTHVLKRLDVARERYDLAIQSNPNDSLAWLLKGVTHAFCDEGEQAVHDTELALTLSPLDPLRYYFDSLAASANVTAGRYERALNLAQRSLRANRCHTSSWRVLTVAQWQLDMRAEARESALELLKLDPAFSVSGYLKSAPGASYAIGKKIAEILLEAGVPN